MRNNPFLFAFLASVLALGGCAISGNLDSARIDKRPTPIQSVALPPLPGSDDLSSGPVATSDKFTQSDQKMLVVDAPDAQSDEIRSDIQQAYADAAFNQPVISTERGSLKPFVGRWTLAATDTKSKIKKIGSFLGVTEACELVLEDESVEYGFKASGNSACPTNLFMLDSWVAYNNRLVLKDHMGDEIVKLTSRDTGIWVGVNKDGNTLILNKS